MTKKRIGTMAACLALVGAVAVGGTLALLTSTSDKVTNTFTVGNGYADDAFKLDEAPVTQDVNGNYVETSGTRLKAINYAQLVSNTTLAKDPTPDLAEGSPDSWVVVYINQVDPLFAQSKFVSENWYKVENTGDTWTVAESPVKNETISRGYYVYGTKIVNGAEMDPIFETLNVGTVTKGRTVSPLKVTGVAVEALATDAAMDNETINVVMGTIGNSLETLANAQ